MTESNVLLEIKDLSVEYLSDGKTVHAVNGVDLCLKRGRTLGLVGETGAGKTSICRSILRILPDVGAEITSGEILMEGKDLLHLKEEEMQKIRGKNISMIFQDPMTALNPVERVGDQIAEVIELHQEQGNHEDAVRRAKEMLEIVGIPGERYYDYPHQFSGGMKQRVVIAIALACSPQLLLADEPTTALDVTIQAQVLDLIEDLQKQYETSMLLVTHDMGVVAQVCDEVAVIYAGTIVEYGTKEQIFDHPSHPYTIGLFGAIPSMSEDEMWLHPIDGMPPDPTDLPAGCPFSPRCPYASEACRKDRIQPAVTPDGHMCRCIRIEQSKKGEH
ncbi:MAG: ABC transporter ATP-binding protein [Solobacterium sp.]|nr:ABC transporter ATP-binding protein [Solobacterium sp.]